MTHHAERTPCALRPRSGQVPGRPEAVGRDGLPVHRAAGAGLGVTRGRAAIAEYLGMPPIAVHEVTTFYNMYNQQPVGKYKLNVCTNLPCQLRDGQKALEHLCRQARASSPGGTTPTACSPCSKRMPGRLRRCAGDAGQRPPDVQLHEQRQARRTGRHPEGARPRSRSDERCSTFPSSRPPAWRPAFHGRHINAADLRRARRQQLALKDYEARGGYAGAAQDPRQGRRGGEGMTPDQVIAEVKAGACAAAAARASPPA
jgi:hypothetical protein